MAYQRSCGVCSRPILSFYFGGGSPPRCLSTPRYRTQCNRYLYLPDVSLSIQIFGTLPSKHEALTQCCFNVLGNSPHYHPTRHVAPTMHVRTLWATPPSRSGAPSSSRPSSKRWANAHLFYPLEIKILSRGVHMGEGGGGQRGSDPPPLELQIFKNYWGLPGASPRNPHIFFILTSQPPPL